VAQGEIDHRHHIYFPKTQNTNSHNQINTVHSDRPALFGRKVTNMGETATSQETKSLPENADVNGAIFDNVSHLLKLQTRWKTCAAI